MSPLVETRLSVVAVSVTEPERVIVPDPPAVRFIVAAEELAFTTMPPLEAVFRLRVVPTVEAPKLTPLASLIYADPDVLSVSVPADVCNSVPDAPMSPEVDNRLTVVPETVKLPLRLIAPAPLAVNVTVAAETSSLTEMFPFDVVARLRTLPAEIPETPRLPVSVM